MARIAASKFQLENRWVPFGRARLEKDHISLSGLGFRKIIRLSDIEEMYWQADILALKYEDGEILEMVMESAALWRYELQTLCGLVDIESDARMFMRSVRKDAVNVEFAGGDGVALKPSKISGDGAPKQIDVTLNVKKPRKTIGRVLPAYPGDGI